MKIILYILSITLQVTGSILLMIYLLSTDRKKIIKKFSNSNTIISEDGNTGEILYNIEAFKDEFKDAYLNKVAFCFIAIGTLMSIFGEKENVNEWILCLIIIFLVICIIITSIKIINKIIEKSININKKITKCELKELGISAELRSIPNEEIGKMFSDKNQRVEPNVSNLKNT